MKKKQNYKLVLLLKLILALMNVSPEEKITKSIRIEPHTAQKVSLTPALSWINIANTTTMEYNTDLQSKEETTNASSNIVMAVIYESAKDTHTQTKQLQSHADQKVSLSPNTTRSNELLEIIKKIENFKLEEQIEPHARLIPDIIINPGSENKEGELKQSPSLVNQEYSGTPVQFLTKTAKPATLNNTTDIISKEETTNSINATTQANLAMAVVNGSEKKENPKKSEIEKNKIKSKEVQPLSDQNLSATPVQSLRTTAIANELLEIIKKIKDFKLKEQIEPHPCLVSDIIVNPDPENEEGELKQSPSHINQEYSETLAMAAVNGSSKISNTEVKQLQLHADPEASLSPRLSWLNTENLNELSEVLTNIKEFIPEVQVEPHQSPLSDMNVNPDPANEEGEFMQSSSDDDQVSASPENNICQVNNLPQQEQFNELDEITRRTIYIGNVDSEISATDLLKSFSVFGSINRVTILSDYFICNPRGYAYIEFIEASSVKWAVTLNCFLMKGRYILVQRKEKDEYGIRLNRREAIILNHIVRLSSKKIMGVYTSLLVPQTQTSMIFDIPVQQNALRELLLQQNVLRELPVQQNVPRPFLVQPYVPRPFFVQQYIPRPFPVQQNGPRPFLVQQNGPRPFPEQQNASMFMPFPIQQNVQMPKPDLTQQYIQRPYYMPNVN